MMAEVTYDPTAGALRAFARNLAAAGEEDLRIAYLMVGESRRLGASDQQLQTAVRDLQDEGVLPRA